MLYCRSAFAAVSAGAERDYGIGGAIVQPTFTNRIIIRIMKAFKKSFHSLFFLASLLLAGSCQKDDSMPAGDVDAADTQLCLVEVGGVFQDVPLDEMPEYLDGGEEGLIRNLYEVLNYPAIAREQGIEGTAIIGYEIAADGKVENLEIVEDPGGGIGEDARSSFEEVTTGISYSPGILDGAPVRVRKEMKFRFSLE